MLFIGLISLWNDSATLYIRAFPFPSGKFPIGEY